MLYNSDISEVNLKICSRCIYDENVNGIIFDNLGICNYCKQIDNLKIQYGTGLKKGEESFEKIVNQIKRDGRGKTYDCILGVSGGTDSSYLAYLIKKKWGLRPLAVHYDNTWNSAISTTNIKKILDSLKIDLHTHVLDNKESDDIFRSFFFAGVAEIEAPTDLGYAYLLRKVAAKYSIKYIMEGHSFEQEGITPLGRNYFDGKYIKSIHQLYGKCKMKTFPLMTFTRFLYSIFFNQVKFVRPLWYLKYSKTEAIKFLKENFNWNYYGGHHLENRMTAFCHSIYLPQKFKADMRNNTLSAQVRNRLISRENAWKIYNTPPQVERELVNYFKKRLELTDEQYKKVMLSKPKNWSDYPTYKKRFELMRPLFFILAKAELVPMSFYLKYCFPTKMN